MKKYLIGIALCSLMAASCQKENVLQQVEDVCTMMDDINFMKYCYDSFDVNNDGRVSMEEANAVSKINVFDKHIISLKGIEYFSRLTELDCSNNQLTSLDVTKNTQLTGLNCNGNQLTALDVTKNTQLTWLNCSYNQLTSLDVTKNTQLRNLYLNPQRAGDITPTGWPK